MKRRSQTTTKRRAYCVALALAALAFGSLNRSRAGDARPPAGGPPTPAGAQESAQKSAAAAPDSQTMAELKKFSPEDLLKELRARERFSRAIDLPDVLLQLREEGITYQPFLKSAKLNPRLRAYESRDIVQALIFEQKGIYGDDNRKDVYLVSSDPKIKAAADAVVSLFSKNRIAPMEDGKNSKIVMKMYGTEYRLCDKEPYYKQPCSAYCSGVLVAPDLVATAGHCVDTPLTGTPPAKDIRFVFGYRMRDKDTAELLIKNEDIYTGTLVQRVYTIAGPDWALVKLDRPVNGYAPVSIRRSSKIADAEDVYVIGHPCGLPAKFADGAVVRSNSDANFFVANLDTYGGNSGSPVFNRKTHEVEGLLVRGEKDFVAEDPAAVNSCQVSFPCPNNGCRGEDCVRTTLFSGLVPTP